MIQLLSVLLGVLGGGLAGYAAARRAIRPLITPPAAPAPPVPAPPPAAAPQPAAEPESSEIGEETLAILTAAVAAFLGKRARIRRARLVPRGTSDPWAQQGRVFVQASHNLPRL